MDDGVGRGLEDRLAHSERVEQVEGDWFRPQRPDPFGAVGRPVAPDHLVSRFNELRNEARADRPARSCDKDSHRVLLRFQAGLLATVATHRAPGEAGLVTSSGSGGSYSYDPA